MTPKSGPTTELLEPLQNFLQTFTQELTEQQFVPAFREEMRRILAAIDNLQQSEESLQQIAKGVDRLREVFAPAGTRLLEGAKDLEAVMRENANDLKDRSSQVLKDLLNTHDQLEAALRNEAGLLQEQTSASREALTRTVADIEARLQSLTATVESASKKLEAETADLAVTSPKRGSKSVAHVSTETSAVPVTVQIPEDLRDLLMRTEATLNVELDRQRKDVLNALQQSSQVHEERLARVDHSLERAMSSVGPRVQEEIDQALQRMEGRLQSRLMTSVPAGKPSGKAEKGESHIAPDAVTGAIVAVENRLVGEMATLRKAWRTDQEATMKSAQELSREFEEICRKQVARVAEETQTIAESVTNLHRLSESVASDEHQAREKLAQIQSAIEALSANHGSQETLDLLRSQSELLSLKVDEDRHVLGQLSASISRAEQAATTATERAHAESRTLREKIDASLKELAERMQRDVVAETDRLQDTLRQLAQAWQSELGALREDLSHLTREAGDNLNVSLKQVQALIEDNRRNDQNAHRDLQAELTRTATSLDERVGNLQSSSDAFATELKSHVKAVSSEVAKARASQEQSLAVLKEAIRANYDESAVRLREIVEGGYDNFVKQISTIPQALERHASLIQSLHQSDQLAMQSIGSDTKNLLGLASQRFDVLVTDSTAIKKFFPLLDRKIEKHAAELDAVRKSQAKHDKELNDVKTVQAHAAQRNEVQGREIKDEIRGLQRETSDNFNGTGQALAEVKTELVALHQEDLPAFRREFATLLSTKFDLMENTIRDRQDALRSEIDKRLDHDQQFNLRVFMGLGAATLIGIALQIGFYLATH